MSDEELETIEPETDNSETTTEEPQSDNSEVEKQEPEQEEDSGVFKTLEEANKGYSELRAKYGQQSNEVGELRKTTEELKKSAEELNQLKEKIAQQELQTAKQSGFNSYQDYQDYYRVAELEANEYFKHINECDFPNEMVNLLNEYKSNPSKELLETIEAEFSTDTLKDVASNLTIMKGQLQAQKQEALEKEYYNAAKQYVDTYVPKYEKDFQNPAFYNMYAEAFSTFGTDLDTDKFVELMHAYGDSILKAHGIETSIKEENKSATDEISALSNNDSSKVSGQEKDLLEMSEKELKEYFRQRRRK